MSKLTPVQLIANGNVALIKSSDMMGRSKHPTDIHLALDPGKEFVVHSVDELPF